MSSIRGPSSLDLFGQSFRQLLVGDLHGQSLVVDLVFNAYSKKEAIESDPSRTSAWARTMDDENRWVAIVFANDAGIAGRSAPWTGHAVRWFTVSRAVTLMSRLTNLRPACTSHAAAPAPRPHPHVGTSVRCPRGYGLSGGVGNAYKLAVEWRMTGTKAADRSVQRQSPTRTLTVQRWPQMQIHCAVRNHD